MFTIKASYDETFEVEAGLEEVREFFTNIKNFIDLMPNIESIQTDNNGVMHWKIRAEVPFIGSFTEKFAVSESENSEERIEWIPVEDEKFNLMKFTSDFAPKGKGKTRIRFAQNLELRRRSASEFHLLAGLAGENLISTEMSRQIGEMLKVFLQKARERLES